jgi:hypothetical protein
MAQCSHRNRADDAHKEMTMTPKQLAAAQTATKKSWLQWKTSRVIYGELSFTLDVIGDSLYIFGSNTDSKEWFDTHFMVCITVGPRGGVNVKAVK